MQRLGAKNIYICTGTGVITESVRSYLSSKGYSLINLGGVDRFATALNIAKEFAKNNVVNTVVVTSGYSPDTLLTIAGIAAYNGWVILPYSSLTTTITPLTPEISQFLQEQNPAQIYLVAYGLIRPDLPGATLIEAVSGDDFPLLILDAFADNINYGKGVFIASGDHKHYVDSLTISAYLDGAPLILTDIDGTFRKEADRLKYLVKASELGVEKVTAVGGTASISELILATAKEVIITRNYSAVPPPEAIPVTPPTTPVHPAVPPPPVNTSGKDFTGKERTRYAEDVAYDLCRQIENDIGIQIFYLPEWTPKQDNERDKHLVPHSYLADFATRDSASKTEYFESVQAELLTMQEAYNMYPTGFLKELIQKKTHKTEIVICPPFFHGFSGRYVYDHGTTQPYVDIIYYTGSAGPVTYSHEMGHMVVEATMIQNGYNDSSAWWDNINKTTDFSGYISGYGMRSRYEDWAETWAYLWTYPESSKKMIANSPVLKQKVQYLTDALVRHYNTIKKDSLPWRSALP